MPCQDKHFCTARNEMVSTKKGFVKCIEDHQCFSDDPCPLQEQFDQYAQQLERQKIKKMHSLTQPKF